MNNTETRLKISIKNGEFELSGSESFVSQQIENLRDIIHSALQSVHCANEKAQTVTASNEHPSAPATSNKISPTQNAYINVLHIEDDKVSVIKAMPGSSNAKKTVNAALIYLWGKKSMGVDTVPFKEIRNLCSTLGCLDSANFSSHMSSAKQFIIITGGKGSSSKTCKLTVPGVNEAERLLSELNGN